MGILSPLQIVSRNGDVHPLDALVRTLQLVQFVYMSPIEEHVLPRLPSDQAQAELQRFQVKLHAMIRTSLSETRYKLLTRDRLMELCSTVLHVDKEDSEEDELDDEDSMKISSSQDRADEARRKCASLMIAMDEVGLGGSEAQRIFAEVVSRLLTAFVDKNYAGKWAAPSLALKYLQDWAQGDFSDFVNEMVSYLLGSRDIVEASQTKMSFEDVSNLQQRIIDDLGALRLRELFDVVVDWDNSRGAVEDLKQCATSTGTRAHLVVYFSEVISQRLLHPGASTLEILQVYICIIRAFAVLDPKGVLLDRLARPIRRYLRDRDDTVKIIVTGLLADPDDETSSTDTLVELATELNKVIESASEDDWADLDFEDMNWQPDPVDVGPEYKKSKSTDVIETLVSLFETKDVFVKEFQNILGERLLKPDCEYDKEERVLELLKLRFGEAPLQACEVMMRDVADSVRTNAWIKREQDIEGRGPQVSAKILSRLYWPALHEETFRLPPELQALQEAYSQGFEHYKSSRKLTWLDVLGQVDVELELEDRTIQETVSTAHASVIYAFQDVDGAQQAVSKTAEQLEQQLQMDEDLVTTALTFWVGKLVLVKSPQDGGYSVLERLPEAAIQDVSAPAVSKASDSTTLAAAVAASAAAASAAPAVKGEEEVAEEKMVVFWQFIVGMLTNQGAMPLQRIVMMLGIAVPGGFPYSNEELRSFLRRRVEEGKVEMVGGSYRIVKGKN